MGMWNRFFSRTRNFTGNNSLDARLQEEIAEHIALQTEDNVRAGMPRAEARRQALLKFGPTQAVRESYHNEEGLPFLESLLQDVRFALRILRKSPAFTLVVIITLALGIGANTTVFSVVDAVLLRPLPFSHPEQLIEIRSNVVGRAAPGAISFPDYFDWRRQNHSFEHLVVYDETGYTLTGKTQPIQLQAVFSSWDLLPLLGAKPELGRGFAPEEEKRGSRVVLISHALWQTQFGADPAIIGRVLQLSGDSFTVIGVMPASFRFPVWAGETAIWTTFAVSDTPIGDGITNRGSHSLSAIGRLRPGVTAGQAEQEMDTIVGQLAKQYPSTNARRQTVQVVPELDAMLGPRKTLLLVILSAVALVLLIACGNVANMLLARLNERTREIAVRAALGASRGRIVRQLLIESLLLSFAGGIAGCVLALLCTPLVLRLMGDTIPRAADAGVNFTVLGFALLVTMLAGLLFGMVPALQAAKTDLVSTLKATGRSSSAGHNRLRSFVIIVEVALGIVLTAGAGLLTSSYVRMMRTDPGFQADHLLTFRFDAPDSRYMKTRPLFYRQFFERLRALPGVESAGGTFLLPMSGDNSQTSFEDPAHPVEASQRSSANMAFQSPGYFHTMQTPILKGREFTDADTLDAPPVMMINHAFAQRYFPGQDPIGKMLKPGVGDAVAGNPRMREVVGVAGDQHQAVAEGETQPTFYLPAAQFPSWCCMAIVARVNGDPHTFDPTMRQLVSQMDKDIPVTDMETMQERMGMQRAQPRFVLVLLGTFAGLALLLTVIGLYGVMMYSVVRRTQEIGVRLALGAKRGYIVRLVLGQAGVLIGVGIVIGLGASLGFASVMKSMLYGTAERDPFVLATVCAVIAIAGFAAAWIPAMRASAIEPMVALRAE